MSFQKSVEKIQELYSRYSFSDIAKSLFVIDLWPPNMLCHVQCTLFSIAFCSMPLSNFSKTDRIKTYKHFFEFSKGLYALSPCFPTIEDYRPTPDWGNIKVQVGRKAFRFFNGSVDDMYDYIIEYKLVYGATEELLRKITGRSPVDELAQLLRFQDNIIAAAKCPPFKKLYNSLEIGEKSTAPQSFWLILTELLDDTNIYAVFDDKLLSRLTAKAGFVSDKILRSEQSFCEFVMTSNSVSACFVTDSRSLFPIMPRSGLEVLLTEWSDIFYENSEALSTDAFQTNLTIGLCNYVSDRILEKDNIKLVSAVLPDKMKSHGTVFTNAIIAEDRIILPYVLPPCILAEQDADKIAKSAFETISEAIGYMNRDPFTAASHEKRGVFMLKPQDGVPPRKNTPLFILPNMSLGPMAFGVNNEPPGAIIPMTHFLAIIDEISSATELSSFLTFLENDENRVFAPDHLDLFAVFREGHGIIIDGVTTQNTHIWIEATWGARFRFESLADFWKEYPDLEVAIIDDYRSMAIRNEGKYSRIYAKNNPSFNFIIVRTSRSIGWVASPFEEQNDSEDRQISSLLMECIGDYLCRLKFVTNHKFFKDNNGFHIHIFPKRMVERSDRFNHLKNLLPKDGELWKCDSGFPKSGTPGGVRIVVDVEAIIVASSKETTNRIELDLTKEILRQAETLFHDRAYKSIVQRLDQIYGGKPRFPIIGIEKEVSYPEHAEKIVALAHDHKQSRKTIAELANKLSIEPGVYTGKIAQDLLNALKKAVVSTINNVTSQYNYAKAVPMVLSVIDSYLFDYNRKKYLVTESLKHDVDYDRGELLGKDDDEFKSLMKSGRYLVEKVVQLKPKGTIAITKNGIRELLALIDKVFEIQGASDVIQYEIGAPKVEISRDFVVSVSYEKEHKEQQAAYGVELARAEIGEIGKAADKIKPLSGDPNKFFEELDSSFKKDFGFRITLLATILSVVLAKWALHNKTEERTSYSANKAEIIETCFSLIDDGFKDRSEIERALDFLVLDDVLSIHGQENPADDLPIWEHIKRHNRYGIRPIVNVDGVYHWGANSAEMAARIWLDAAFRFETPSNIGGDDTTKFLEIYNKKLDTMLEGKAKEIAERFTKKLKLNLKFGKTHPQSIGEYDVLAFIESKNIILNIECKDIKPPYCHKDAKRIREKIFGKPDHNDSGYLAKVENREQYLREHLADFEKTLNWGIKPDAQIISIFVTKYPYWWTKYPPRNTRVRFTQIDFLDSFIRDVAIND